MKQSMQLQGILGDARGRRSSQLAVFALLSLGLVESLSNRFVSPSDAVRDFFSADNCLFVRKRLRSKVADEIMSRGVQLPDLFEALPAEEARREFEQELSTMRGLCFRLLGQKRSVA